MLNSRKYEWLLVWIFLAGANASAQDNVLPLPGALLRVTAPLLSPKPIIGTLVQSTEGEFVLALANSERRSIPHEAVMHLEWSRGRRGNVGKGVLWGALIGGTILALVAGNECDGGSYELGCSAVFFLLGAGLGGMGGAGVGSLIRTEDWADVSLAPFDRAGASAQDKVSPLPPPGALLRVTAPTLSPEPITGTLFPEHRRRAGARSPWLRAQVYPSQYRHAPRVESWATWACR